MLLNWIVFLLIGQVLIFLWDNFPLPDILEQNQKIYKLHHCHLCSGVWIYTFLAYVMKISLLQSLGFEHVWVVGDFITGGLVSFISHIFITGWKEIFEERLVI